ncbi:glycosyl hydrolase 53 family protein [Pseudaeromonas sp. ZJS20]|uniref:glycoside hydrolase family 53 protein n=1 Tax=Pseudaeromonas aegiceratis TaxID=3153928 RepID=UPI00390C4066
MLSGMMRGLLAMAWLCSLPAWAFIRGADVSGLPQLEAQGAHYSDEQGQADLLVILKRNGFNAVRLRVWNQPGQDPRFPANQSGPEGYSSPAQVVAMARRAQALGLEVMIDFHYSDWWADPSKQYIPVAWADMRVPEMTQALADFTRQTLQQLKQAGVTPKWVQLGNEITHGLLWPVGKVPQWDNLAGFLKAGGAAVKEVFPQAQLVLHLDCGGDNRSARRWFDTITGLNVPYDLIGLSFYPVWHGSLAQLTANLTDLQARYHKPLMVVEAAYPWTTQNGDQEQNIYTDTGPETDPMTPAGQAAYLTRLNQAVTAAGGEGIFYWAPEWIPTPGAGKNAVTGWDNVTLFDFDGRALPGLKALGQGVTP